MTPCFQPINEVGGGNRHIQHVHVHRHTHTHTHTHIHIHRRTTVITPTAHASKVNNALVCNYVYTTLVGALNYKQHTQSNFISTYSMNYMYKMYNNNYAD